jgi:hypothetical protein
VLQRFRRRPERRRPHLADANAKSEASKRFLSDEQRCIQEENNNYMRSTKSATFNLGGKK